MPPGAGGFNRTILECKANNIPRALVPYNRFNRTILECKVFKNNGRDVALVGFNRTILECKVDREAEVEVVVVDLIEPYWNVKDNCRNPG